MGTAQDRMRSPAREVAAKHGIMLIELVPDEASGAGAFTLRLGDEAITTAMTEHGGLAEGDDIALVLHTSGTTSRPKIVPLSHRNVCAVFRPTDQ